MKKFLTLIAYLSIFTFVHSQPVINSDVLAIKGDTFYMGYDSTLVPPGVSGTNVTWDFSSSVHKDILIARIYLDPSATAYASKFPNAKLCRTDGVGAVNSYWDNTNASKSVYYGFVEKNIYDQNYNSLPINYYKFPISFGNNYTDSLSAITNPGALVGAGKYYFSADGWGTIKLPQITHTNVLRTKSVIYVGDSSINNYSLTTEYAWYKPSRKEPVMVISSVIINQVLHRRFIIYDINWLHVGVNEISLRDVINICPNPAHDQLSISSGFYSQQLTIKILDMTGKLIKEDEFTGDSDMDISNLSSGIYFIQILSGDKSFMQKLVKN